MFSTITIFKVAFPEREWAFLIGLLSDFHTLTDSFLQVFLVVIAVFGRREIIDIPIVALEAEGNGGLYIAEVMDVQIHKGR